MAQCSFFIFSIYGNLIIVLNNNPTSPFHDQNKKSYGESAPYLKSQSKSNFVISGKINITKGGFDWIKFLGEIKNTGDRKARFIKIHFTRYDNNGTVIGTEFTYTTPTDLEPQQIGTFDCGTIVLYSKVAKYKYHIE